MIPEPTDDEDTQETKNSENSGNSGNSGTPRPLLSLSVEDKRMALVTFFVTVAANLATVVIVAFGIVAVRYGATANNHLNHAEDSLPKWLSGTISSIIAVLIVAGLWIGFSKRAAFIRQRIIQDWFSERHPRILMLAGWALIACAVVGILLIVFQTLELLGTAAGISK